MNIIIVLLTVVLVLDCLFLGLLVLVQLPKKEAGIGMAFGGGAADALFGAGSGTALSNLTKYSATVFFVLVFALSVLITHAKNGGAADLNRALMKQPVPVSPASLAPPPAAPASNQSATAAPAMPVVPMSAMSNSAPAAPTAISNLPVVPAK